jgi:hypothetical protein
MDFEAGEEARTLSMDFEGWRSSKGKMVDLDLGGDSAAPIKGGGNFTRVVVEFVPPHSFQRASSWHLHGWPYRPDSPFWPSRG